MLPKASNRLEAFHRYLENREPYDPNFDWVEYPKSVARIKREVIELQGMGDLKVQELYTDFSTYAYCAGWMDTSPGTLQSFRRWLLLKPGETLEFCDFGEPEWYCHFD